MTRSKLITQAAERLRATAPWVDLLPNDLRDTLAVEAATTAVDTVLAELGITAPATDDRRPRRIQRQRTRGWKTPDGAEYVSRPTKWGNPFLIGAGLPAVDSGHAVEVRASDHAHAVELFEAWLAGRLVLPPESRMSRPPTREKIKRELAGRDLVCWCPLVDERGNHVPCHADILIEIANGDD